MKQKLNGICALVTGGAGFIGSHLVGALLQQGARVRVLDNLFSGREDNLKKVWDKIEFVKGDTRDRSVVEKTVSGVDVVFHQAALRSVPKSMEKPLEYHEVNITGTLNLLEAARLHKVKKFILASSSSVYGEAHFFPQKETQPTSPISPYALTKLAGEFYCKLFAQVYGLPTISLRYFNVFGPRQSLDDEYSVVIPRFIHSALHNEPLPIYGDGTQSRDFTFVDNVVQANIAAFVSDTGSGEAFNVGCGQSHSINDLAARIKKIIGAHSVVKYLPPRPGDVLKTHADLSEITKKIGYVPTVEFEPGLTKTIEAFRENFTNKVA